jgi:hypothetical protein
MKKKTATGTRQPGIALSIVGLPSRAEFLYSFVSKQPTASDFMRNEPGEAYNKIIWV